MELLPMGAAGPSDGARRVYRRYLPVPNHKVKTGMGMHRNNGGGNNRPLRVCVQAKPKMRNLTRKALPDNVHTAQLQTGRGREDGRARFQAPARSRDRQMQGATLFTRARRLAALHAQSTNPNKYVSARLRKSQELRVAACACAAASRNSKDARDIQQRAVQPSQRTMCVPLRVAQTMTCFESL